MIVTNIVTLLSKYGTDGISLIINKLNDEQSESNTVIKEVSNDLQKALRHYGQPSSDESSK